MAMHDLILPISFWMSLVSWALIAKWYWMPNLSRKTFADAVMPLLLLHTFRHIGLAFILPGLPKEALDPRFADPTAYGDLLAAVLAFVAMLALRMRWGGALALVWIFNVVGFLDLLNALPRGILLVPTGHLGSLHFIPAVIVPLLLVTHWMVFVLLRRRRALGA